ncbi:hypothetical protein Hanom_Chr16g01444101 [Helianthus anomalus]
MVSLICAVDVVCFSADESMITLRAFTPNPSNYTYIPLKNNSYINIFPLKTNTFSLSFQLNNIIITFFSNFHSQPLSKYIKKL